MSVVESEGLSLLALRSESASDQHKMSLHVLPAELWERILLLTSKEDIPNVMMVTNQYHSIFASELFRARYFMHRHMKCQVLFEVSRHHKIFTLSLLKCLWRMGAVLSRHFVHSICRAYYGRNYQNNQFGWPFRISFRIMLALQERAALLYGSSMDPGGHRNDDSVVAEWIRGAQRHILTKAIKSIFVDYRYACFDQSRYYECQVLCEVVANHPQLSKTIVVNGFEFDESLQSKAFMSLICDHRLLHEVDQSKINIQAEEMYNKVICVLQYCPGWKASVALCNELIPLYHFGFMHPFNTDQEQTPISLQNDGLGPIPAAYKVLKRLYTEEKLFHDLKKALATLVKRSILGPFASESAPCFRVLYHLFPDMLTEVREDIADLFVRLYSSKIAALNNPESFKIGFIQNLLSVLSGLSLSPVQLMRALSKNDTSLDLMNSAVKAGLFGTNWMEEIDILMQTMINSCIVGSPMHGARLQEMDIVFKDCCQWQNQELHEPYVHCEDLFKRNLEVVLSTWAFNLDFLKPDVVSIPAAMRFKTPLGWMTDKRTSIHSRSSCCSIKKLTIQDPHGLLPTSNQEGWDPKSHLTYFTLTQDSQTSSSSHRSQLLLETGNREEHAGQLVSTSEVFAGWKHLGRLDEVSGQIHPSKDDNAIDANRTQVEDMIKQVNISQHKDNSVRRDDASSEATEMNGRHSMAKGYISLYQSTSKECKCPFGKRGEDLATVILDYLGPDNQAVRDVLLAHALVNGNVELCEKLLHGSSDCASTESDEIVSDIPEDLVRPTFAHLLILQKLGRGIDHSFIDMIVLGSRFRRGFVKSSCYQELENSVTIEDQRPWYIAEDEGPMMSLWKEKARLESQDQITHSQSYDKDHPSYTVAYSSFDDEDSLVLMDALAMSQERCFPVEILGSKDDFTVLDLHSFYKSRAIWLQHLQLLQWFEKRKERLEQEASSVMDQNSSTSSNDTRSSFSLHLDVMIMEIGTTQNQLQQMWDGKVQALREARDKLKRVEKIKKETSTQTSPVLQSRGVNSHPTEASRKIIPKKRKQSESNENDFGADYTDGTVDCGAEVVLAEANKFRRITRSMTKNSK